MSTSRACSSLITLINIFGIGNILDDEMHEDQFFLENMMLRLTESAYRLHKPDKLSYAAGNIKVKW